MRGSCHRLWCGDEHNLEESIELFFSCFRRRYPLFRAWREVLELSFELWIRTMYRVRGILEDPQSVLHPVFNIWWGTVVSKHGAQAITI